VSQSETAPGPASSSGQWRWRLALTALTAMSVGSAAIAPVRAVQSVTNVHALSAERFGVGDGSISSAGSARDRACRVCHGSPTASVPSGAMVQGAAAGWVMYGSDSAQLTWIDGQIESAPTGSSKLCLGCHDGLVAADQYTGSGGASGRAGGGAIPLIGGTGARLANNHPISIRYAWGRDPGLRDPNSARMADGRTVSSLLEDGRVECATCHDPHGIASLPGTPLLRETTTGSDRTGRGASQLCFVCHDQ